MTKRNYERERARREYSGKLAEAQEIKHSRESTHIMLFLGSCLIQERESLQPHETAKTLWKIAKKQAEELHPAIEE